jgi:hypothetical protein
MDVGSSTVREARTRHRHDLRTLTYVTLDQANGGIIRNLSHEGIAVQLVAAVRPRQQMRVRFELRHPRLRVETRGEVVWATFSGQCGIRFLDLSPRTVRQIDEWIFSNLLEAIPLGFVSNQPALNQPPSNQHVWNQPVREDQSWANQGSRLKVDVEPGVDIEEDGLMVSSAAVKVIELPSRSAPENLSREPMRSGVASDVLSRDLRASGAYSDAAEIAEPVPTLDWLSQPLSGRSLAWTVNVLAVVAALLLFVMIFLSVTGELPRWPYALASGAAVLVAGLYWGFFKLFGGSSPGVRLARLAGYEMEEEEESAAPRFR